jgi:hypothetical protein
MMATGFFLTWTEVAPKRSNLDSPLDRRIVSNVIHSCVATWTAVPIAADPGARSCFVVAEIYGGAVGVNFSYM